MCRFFQLEVSVRDDLARRLLLWNPEATRHRRRLGLLWPLWWLARRHGGVAMSCDRCGSRTPWNTLCKQCALRERHTPARDADADTAATDDPNEYRCCACETEYLDDGLSGCPNCGSKRRQYIGELATDGGRCVAGTDHFDTHCSRCGGEYPNKRENALCESCVKYIQMSKLMDGVPCDRCNGSGWIYGTICDIRRAMNRHDTCCPECHGSGHVAWEPDPDDVHPDLRTEVKARVE